MTDKNSSDSDEDFDNVDNLTDDHTKFYQIQFVSGDKYKFSCVGFFKKNTNISIELDKFETDDIYCVILTNFMNFSYYDSGLLKTKDNFYLFDMITLDVLNKKNNDRYKLVVSIEMTDPNLETENKGNMMIWIHHNGKMIPLKTDLTHPGNDKLIYYVVNELKNEKINDIINMNVEK